MSNTIELASALQNLPLETPQFGVWQAVQSQLPNPISRWKRPAFAMAASVILVLLIWQNQSVIGGSFLPTPNESAPKLANNLMQQSAQLENVFYARQDDSISSASLIAANLTIEEQLSAIDEQLNAIGAASMNSTAANALWQQRVSILYQGVALNTQNAQHNASGQSYDPSLAIMN